MSICRVLKNNFTLKKPQTCCQLVCRMLFSYFASTLIAFSIILAISFIPKINRYISILSKKLSISKRILQIFISTILSSSISLIVPIGILMCCKKNKKKKSSVKSQEDYFKHVDFSNTQPFPNELLMDLSPMQFSIIL